MYRAPVNVTDPVKAATAELISPGYLVLGAEEDVAARVAEYGADFESWPCWEWDWARHVWTTDLAGRQVDVA